MFFRVGLMIVSSGIIALGAWLQFVEPAKKIVRVEEVFPGSLGSKVELSERIFPNNGQVISGTLKVVTDGDDTFIRIENFWYKPKIPACKDIQIILTTGDDPQEGVYLGNLKGTEGDMNYILPPNIKYKDFTQVVLWCSNFKSMYAHANAVKKIDKPLFLRGE